MPFDRRLKGSGHRSEVGVTVAPSSAFALGPDVAAAAQRFGAVLGGAFNEQGVGVSRSAQPLLTPVPLRHSVMPSSRLFRPVSCPFSVSTGI